MNNIQSSDYVWGVLGGGANLVATSTVGDVFLSLVSAILVTVVIPVVLATARVWVTERSGRAAAEAALAETIAREGELLKALRDAQDKLADRPVFPGPAPESN